MFIFSYQSSVVSYQSIGGERSIVSSQGNSYQFPELRMMRILGGDPKEICFQENLLFLPNCGIINV